MIRLISLLAIMLAIGSGVTARAGDHPNVLILLSDDLGYRDVGCYGGPVRTPAIDTLAAGGVRFTDFYSGCAVCSPSRATLLTGRHHIRTGVYSWIHDASQRSHLLRRETTLAERLRDVGYRTAHVGKWHLGLPTEQRQKPTPADHGFDHWFATANNAHPSHRNPNNLVRNGSPVGELSGYSCQLVADEAIRWLDQADSDDESPFFLNVWFHEPHAPLAAPPDLVREYGDADDRGALYSATIANADRAIDRIIGRLKELDAYDNTLIIYASDNGSYRRDRVGNLRGQKGVNWEGGIRVPGIFHWPGHLSAKVVRGTPAGLVDVMPTVCGLLGIDPPDVHLDGSDLSPLLMNQPEQFERHQPLFWHLQKSRPIVAMRDGNYSLVADPDFELSTDNMFREDWIPKIKSGEYTNFRLYDLVNDPGQTRDLAAERPELMRRMKAKLLEINDSVMADGADWHSKRGTTVHRDLTYATVGGRDLKLDLHLPEGVTNPRMIVWFHGGGWRKGSKNKPAIRGLLNHGWGIASVAYRFTDTDIFPAQIHDGKAAVRWLRAHADQYGYLADRLAVAGSSAGGHLALLMGVSAGMPELEGKLGEHRDQSSRVQAIVDFYGPSDFILRRKTQPDRALTTKSGSYALLGGIRDGRIDPELERLASPALHVTDDDPPLLMLHGTRDSVVLMDQSERMRQAYLDHGLNAELIVMEGSGHGGVEYFDQPIIERIARFLRRSIATDRE